MDAVKLAVIGAVLLLAGGGAVLGGVLPAADALAIADRVWPILLFVVAVTVVAELAAAAGVFDVVAAWLARLARGRTVVLWLAVVALAVVVTAFLSLDTTAVLLTPVVVVVARANGLNPLPFAFTTVWLANTGSLFLPVSNLTNLLAAHRLDDGTPWGFLALLGPSAVVAVAVSVALLLAIHRRHLRGRYVPAPAPRVADRVLLRAASVVVLVLLPLLVSGVPPWRPALAAAAAMTCLYAWRRPGRLRLGLVPWHLVVFASGLFLAVGALQAAGAGALIAAVAGSGDDLVSLWRLAGAGLVVSNAIDNLPAYLALEPVADSPVRLAALLIGVNAGPLITPWASLATLLWHDRLRAVGVDVPWRRYVLLGLVAAPLIVALAVLPLAR
ncbi:SLC13 family permease [Microbacterium sp. zg.Y1090]|uniref:SLC13 family permease n=1 Tax=Microbacterium wangruii TaxID=3049073 RepID=UPI00214D4FF2|nr:MULTISPECIES: SLC13 family permease [unclassified Microbacterium]MCR2818698.1 SLC13 family permease [Microbacterium sp. zg.Y1090]MDL5486511.1 SLC13 family permease [Microbacterium sp. zg-Y1211]WIM29726.1 SLC13 family permease [Microbacterium sp. zg-Y1090]